MRRIDRIKKIIMEQIKPEDCKVVFDNKDYGMHGYYLFYSKTVYIKCGDTKHQNYVRHGKYVILYILLHEICHHITWKKGWGCPSSILRVRKDRYKYRRGSRYLCEYRTERMLRKICKQYGWYEILAASDDNIRQVKSHLPYNKLTAQYLWGWDYAFKRLSREENLHAQSPQG